MKLSVGQKQELVNELRKIYEHCVSTGYVPSKNFVALGRQLKADIQRKASSYDGDDPEELYQAQTREQVEEWLEAVEANVENEGRGGTVYGDKEKQFVEDMRSNFCERSGTNKPLTGKQLRWLKSLYDKS